MKISLTDVKNVLKSNMACVIYALLTVCFIGAGISDGAYLLFERMDSTLTGTCIFAGLFLIYRWILRNAEGKITFVNGLFCIFFTAFFTYFIMTGTYFRLKSKQSLRVFFFGSKNVILTTVTSTAGVLIFCILFYVGVHACYRWYQAKKASVECRTGKYTNWLFSGHSSVKQILLLLIIWIPQACIRYPGVLTDDGAYDLQQYYGYQPHTTKHPLTYKMALGLFSDLGLLVGNARIGLFLLMLCQIALALLVITYTIRILRKVGVPKWYCMIVYFFFMFSPVVLPWLTTAKLDAVYACFFLLMMDELIFYFYCREEYRSSWKQYLLTVIAVLGSFFRLNGFYVVLIVAVIVVMREVYFLIKKKEQFWRSILIVAVLLIPLFTTREVINYTNAQMNAKVYGKRVMLGLMEQQIARYIITYGDDISEEELDIIQRVFVWERDDYKERYNPYTYDDIKGGYNFEATNEEIAAYLKVWFQLFWRHPGVYISATTHQVYTLFDVFVDNQQYHRNSQNTLNENRNAELHSMFAVSDELKGIAREVTKLYYIIGTLPIFGLMVNQGFCCMVLMAITLIALNRKKWDFFLLCIPLWIIVLTIIAGPIVIKHARYAYPIMYTLPILAAVFLTGFGMERAAVETTEMSDTDSADEETVEIADTGIADEETVEMSDAGETDEEVRTIYEESRSDYIP